MEKNNSKAWLYLIPAILFLGVFMIYPLVDVLIYSFEEGYNFASQSYSGIGFYNYSYVLHDPYFVQALKKYHTSCCNNGSHINDSVVTYFCGIK